MLAVNLAMGLDGNGNTELVDPAAAMTVSFVSLAVTVAVSLFARGFLSLVPILCGVVVGYLVSLPFGLVDFAPVGLAIVHQLVAVALFVSILRARFLSLYPIATSLKEIRA